MPSFDIISKVDAQTAENAINVAKKEVTNRYDFHGSKSEIDFNKKDLVINITTENDMRLDAIIDILISRAGKQGIDPRAFDVSGVDRDGAALGRIFGGIFEQVNQELFDQESIHP